MDSKRADGLFISEHQRVFEWLGKTDYLAYRVTDGMVDDNKYKEFLPEIKKAPRRIAVHNFRNHKTGVEQAMNFLGKLECEPHAISGDYEDTATPMTELSAREYEKFLHICAEETGLPILSYANASTIAHHLNAHTSITEEFDLWIARLAPSGANVDLEQPKLDYYGVIFANDWRFWQFSWTGDGSFYGVGSDNICLDVFNGTVAQLDKYFNIVEIDPPPPDELVTRVNKLEFLYQELNTDLEELALKFASHRVADKVVEEAMWDKMAKNKTAIDDLGEAVWNWILSHKHKVFWWMK